MASDSSIANKRVLITGANAGIGKATATALANKGAEIIIVGRNQQKIQAAASEISALTGNSAVTAFTADLSLLADIRRFASEFLSRFDRLDVLINNVGGLYSKRGETSEGFEASFAINFLGPFLLTQLLLPTLEKSEQGRIVNINSGMHRFAKLNLEDLQAKSSYRGMEVYGNTKLLNLMTSYELARQLKNTNSKVSVISVDPGEANTEMQAGFTSDALPTLMRLILPIYRLINSHIPTPDEAAKSSVIAATSPEFAGASGIFLNPKGKVAKSSKASYDQNLTRKAWEIAQNLTNTTSTKQEATTHS